ncbi:polysaccharide biosynthesis family protein, partial [Vibrio harveyi]
PSYLVLQRQYMVILHLCLSLKTSQLAQLTLTAVVS